MPTIEQLEKLLEVDPHDAFVLYGLAHEHAKHGDHDAAVDFYDRCLAADPDYCYAYFHKAMSLIELDRRDDAADTLREGLAASQRAGDAKAASEITALLETLSD